MYEKERILVGFNWTSLTFTFHTFRNMYGNDPYKYSNKMLEPVYPYLPFAIYFI